MLSVLTFLPPIIGVGALLLFALKRRKRHQLVLKQLEAILQFGDGTDHSFRRR